MLSGAPSMIHQSQAAVNQRVRLARCRSSGKAPVPDVYYTSIGIGKLDTYDTIRPGALGTCCIAPIMILRAIAIASE